MPETTVRVLSAADASDCKAWDAFVASRPEASAYHGMVWCAIIQDAFGHPAYPLAAYRDGVIRGVLPLVLVAGRLFGRFLVSMPFVNYGGVLAEDAHSTAVLLRKAEELMRDLSARSVELRRFGAARVDMPGRGHKVTMLLQLAPDPDSMWNGFKDKVRNQVRKAQKNGLQTETGGADLLNEFYEVFCVNMRALGTPVYGKNFFAAVLRRLPGAVRIISVRQGEKTLAAGITYTHGTTMEIPWASSLPAFRQLCPNNLLYWEAIRQAALQGLSLFDFGRSSPGSGPLRFKAQWGAHEKPLCWDYLLPPGRQLPDLTTSNPKFRLATAVWKKLPLGLTRLLGPRIVRCIP